MTEAADILLVGCGDIATRAGLALQADGHRITALRRHPHTLPAAFATVAADVCQPQSLNSLRGRHFAVVIITLTPGARTADAYQAVFADGLSNLLAALAQQPPGHIVFASSTSVYGQHDGELVTETSATQPAGFAGTSLVQAEAMLAAYTCPSTVLRFGGIYGPGRTALLNQVRQGKRPALPHCISNRIHSEDCGRLLAWCARRAIAGLPLAPCYVAVDNQPAALGEVVNWLRQQLAVVQLHPEAMPARAGSKRCSNALLRSHGFELSYPGYQQGYATLLGGADATV